MSDTVKSIGKLFFLFFIFYTIKSNAQCPLAIDNAIFIAPGMSGFTGSVDPGDKLGNSVEVIGDVNQDGIEDMAVGAPNDDDGGTNAGAVWIIFMNSDGTVKGQQKISLLSGGFSGDVGDIFGAEVESIGDFDKDGIPDIAVFSRQGTTDDGTVFFLFLKNDGTVKSVKEISNTVGNWSPNILPWSNFGTAIQNMGDLNNDGTIDLAISAPYDNDGGVDYGSIFIVYLNPDATVKSYTKISKTQGGYTGPFADIDIFGLSLANVGDLDKDGNTDLATGFYGDDGGVNKGAVVILFLNNNGTVKGYQRISSTSGNFTGSLDNSDYFGYELKFIGDTNGDSFPELLVSAAGDDDGGTDVGAIWILSLNSNGTVHHHDKISSTTGHNTDLKLNSGDVFGVGISVFPDLNNDTYPELVVGISNSDLSGTDVGAVYFLSLTATTAQISVKDIKVCVNSNIIVKSLSKGYTSLQWTINNVNDATTADLTFNKSTKGMYNIELQVTNGTCVVSDNAIIEVVDYPVISIEEDIDVIYGHPITLSACCGDDYIWSPGTYLSSIYVPNPILTAESDIQYQLTVTNRGACSSSKEINIHVAYEIFIPQLFTPNGDQDNDLFKVYGAGIKQMSFSIYNSWGQRVYYSSSIDDITTNGWDGIYNGTEQPNGTYIWKLEGIFVNDTPVEFKGSKTGSLLLSR